MQTVHDTAWRCRSCCFSSRSSTPLLWHRGKSLWSWCSEDHRDAPVAVHRHGGRRSCSHAAMLSSSCLLRQLKFLRTVPRQAEVALRRVFLSPRRPTFVGCRGLGVPGSPRIYSQVTWHHNSMHATRCGMDRHNSTRRSPERENKSENCVGEGKEREIWGPPPFGAPPFGGPTLRGPHLEIG